MESILGQPSRFTFCSRFSVLTDELSTLQKDTTILVISCLTEIVANLLSSTDQKTAIEKAMSSIGSILRDLTRNNPRLRILIVHCTPRGIPADYDAHSKFAMVNKWFRKLSKFEYFELICMNCVSAMSLGFGQGTRGHLILALVKRVWT